MAVAVFSNNEQWEEIKSLSINVDFIRINNVNELAPNVTAYFILTNINGDKFPVNDIPVFINAVTNTLHSLNAPDNVIRFNGWKGFLKNETWELAGKISTAAASVLAALNKKYIAVADEPGFIAARIIAMIINEAYFALGENISTKEEIDIAMKLGTNYPYGPFEWSKIIGPENIFLLLNTLSLTDKRCTPAPLLQKEAKAWQ